MRLTLLTAIVLITTSCVSIKSYEKASQDVVDCLCGIKMPADEFCTEWHSKMWEIREKLDVQLTKLAAKDSLEYFLFLEKIEVIDSLRTERTKNLF